MNLRKVSKLSRSRLKNILLLRLSEDYRNEVSRWSKHAEIARIIPYFFRYAYFFILYYNFIHTRLTTIFQNSISGAYARSPSSGYSSTGSCSISYDIVTVFYHKIFVYKTWFIWISFYLWVIDYCWGMQNSWNYCVKHLHGFPDISQNFCWHAQW